ncbi:hypothetical protein N42HA_00329 [Lactococcus lactis]|uniref:Uncharacterized protein n=1 Tax=Lactococcus lactis subsp. lactis TaxID=1360 RepID=A0A0V8EM59_LACLL|nr:hypothetical protein [Lactococcus lactis]KSU26844.1 hypothetical protein N42_1379 [Lactococcus lactis subsp. lactis]MDU0407343.1 hypothetical protein [Lactococcus lactis]TRW68264.1 hypothetical protein FNJ58_10960 [Lactococcus lactis]
MTYEKAWRILERQARQFFLKSQKRQTGEANEDKLHDFIREKFEIVEFDKDVIIFCDEYEQTYEHDIV